MAEVAKSQSKAGRNLRWNFAMGLFHGTFLFGGRAFGNPDTIIPVFLKNFTTSKTIIGLSSTVMGSLGGIGTVLPQLFVASKLENTVHKKPVLMVVIIVRALCWGFLALSTYLVAATHPNLMIVLLFFFLVLFTLMAGIGVVPFYDIWAKAIPSTLRGRFFGHRQLWGGLLAIGSGLIAKAVLGNERIPFPNNYAILFSLAFVFLSIAYVSLASVKEPVEEVHKNRLSFGDFLWKAFQILKSDHNFRHFLFVQILVGASALALPFYVLYAREVLNVRLEMVGLFLSAQMLGSVLSNVLWAHLSDFVGNRRVVQVSAFVSVLIPAIALTTRGGFSVLFILVFVLAGSFIAGRRIGRTNFLLDAAPPKDRPVYIGLNGTLSLPVMIFPLLGGMIVQHLSYVFLFGVALSVVLVGFVLSLGLKEPRKEGTSGIQKTNPFSGKNLR